MPRAKKPSNLTPEEEARAIDALLQEKLHRLQNQQGPWATKRKASLNAEVGRLRQRRALVGRMIEDKRKVFPAPFVSARALYLVEKAQGRVPEYGTPLTSRRSNNIFHTCALRGGDRAHCTECQRLVDHGDSRGVADQHAVALPDGVFQRPQTRQEVARVLCGDPVYGRRDGLLTRDDLCAPGPDPSVAARGDVHARGVDLRAAPVAPPGFAEWDRIGDLFAAIDDDLACLTRCLTEKTKSELRSAFSVVLRDARGAAGDGPDVQQVDPGRQRTAQEDITMVGEQGSPVLVAPGEL